MELELELPELEPEEPDDPEELDEPDEPDELDDPEPEVLEPLDDGVVVVEELVAALEPVVPVLDVLVVAASATSAPPVTRPVVSAPIANTFRSRIFIGCCPFVSCDAPPRSGEALTRCAPDLWPGAQQEQCAGCVS